MPLPEILSTQNLPFPGLEKSMGGLAPLSQACCWVIGSVFVISVVGLLVRLTRMNHASRADGEFTTAFRGSPHMLALFQDAVVFAGSPRAAIYQNACRELSWHLLGTDAVDKSFTAKLRTAGRIAPEQAGAVQRTTHHVASQLARPFTRGLDALGVWSLPVLGLISFLLCLLDGLGAGGFGASTWISAFWPLVASLLLFLPGLLLRQAAVRRSQRAAQELQDFAVEMGVSLDRMFVEHRQSIEPLPSLGSMGLLDGPDFSVSPSEMTRVPQRSI